jgi:hypothetical protein
LQPCSSWMIIAYCCVDVLVGLFSTAFQQPILNWAGPFTNPTGSGSGLKFHPWVRVWV